MNSLRLSSACLTLAALTGGMRLLPENVWLAAPESWDGTLRGLCLAGLVGFAVALMVGLDRRALVKS